MPGQLTHADSRRFELLDRAAACFRRSGFQATSIRDLGRELGMTPGGIYAHFRSKEELLLEVYTRGVEEILAYVQQALAEAGPSPANRLRAAMRAHAEYLLSGGDYAQVVIRVLPDEAPASIRAPLTRMRDRYEALFVEIIARLPLQSGVDATLFRLLVLGALNSAQRWYRQGRRTPQDIADCMFQMIAGSLRKTP
ncbi:MAG TPA: TetR/AcrR family transcriptional regulator [Ramlibacter sp.]|uniref:TetR/AcrR family transcriptional regulator n=1 Tax=Ramlibacter sp. TaxID=1917967 RepID=UPI002B736612|nr:TetR/AcrR family transcriptional regulator [Ramlibacter sp.]HVZ44756.1 TetR/AcrR family transcriptional regulator [Ramlibacter sp.]